MRPIKVIADSTCDLSEYLIDKYNIEIVSLYININNQSYKDLKEITTDELYNYVEQDNILPKTAAIPVSDFVEVFKKWTDEGYDIFYTGISSKLSSSYSNSLVAINELGLGDKILSVDSLNLSSGVGLVILKACNLINEGKSLIEIKEELQKIIPEVRSQFIIDRFDYLYKGGRCSSMARIFGTMLKIKPLITVRDGKMVVAEKPHGKKIKGLQALLRFLERDKDNLDLENVFITHTKADSEALFLKEEILKTYNFKNIFITNAGSTIASHCGPGTIGILYIVKK